jgi:hypothetical protein
MKRVMGETCVSCSGWRTFGKAGVEYTDSSGAAVFEVNSKSPICRARLPSKLVLSGHALRARQDGRANPRRWSRPESGY